MPDDDLIATVRSEAERAVPMDEAPDAVHVARWDRAMPQYEVGHLYRLDRIDRALAPLQGVFLAGSAYRGVGIADCVRQGEEAAVRVREFLESRPAPSEPLEREVR
jgi:oxygen-dependent protoporphyrinogen oxidase